jgi:hypothetical protein
LDVRENVPGPQAASAYIWPIADEEAQLARLAEEALPKITAPRRRMQKPVPNRDLRAN